jgi:cation diffusion facilitator family transporter
MTVGAAGQVRRAGWVGLVSNLVLAAAKLTAGVVGHSHAVVADAVHSLTDVVTDVAVIVGVGVWSKPADTRHPHGHRRIETLVTVVIGSVLAAVAVGLVWDAFLGQEHAAGDSPAVIALAAALVSIVTKETLYRWTRAVGRRVESPALIANAWHHRSDALSSVPAALAVAVAVVRPQWAIVDRIGAVVVCVFIFHAGWRIVSPAIAQLVDTGAPEADRQRIEQIALGVKGVMSAHALRTRYVGPHLAVDMHVEVGDDLSVAEGYEIGQAVRRELIALGPNVADVLVQVEPYSDRGGADPVSTGEIPVLAAHE